MRYLGLFLVVVLGLVLGRAAFSLIQGLSVGSEGLTVPALPQNAQYTGVKVPVQK